MIPLIYIGLLSFGSSFTTTFICIKWKFKKYINEINIHKFNSTKMKFNNTKIKFHNMVEVRFIESRKELSYNLLDKLWYNKNDYKKFKLDFVKSRYI